jgi:transposase
MPTQYNTGLDEDDFDFLVEAVHEILAREEQPMERKTVGRPHALDLPEQVHLTLLLLRTNITQQLAADIFGVSQPTVSLVKSRVEPLIAHALADVGVPLAEAARGRTLVVDGTHIPTGNRKATGRTNYSGKRHRQCLSVQVACDLTGTLLATSDPVPGARHDAAAIELTGWADTLAAANWIADSAYSATNAITPIRRRPGSELHETERAFNKQLSQLRYVVERCISHLKNWKILATGYRRRLRQLPSIIALVTKLELYRLGW